MFEQADRLVGIYKVNDRTNTATINPNAKLGEITDLSQDSEVESDKENAVPVA